ncbi:hybrid sensor histidine kinase/response regulator transcription factor [Reichenbachiella ulvae]|uniref:histidine kinase n=1 Tax=Reichenbachiella ulvae TaxID=2980104 RepID=A0ABT3CUR9_9BACT|nr:two-component regulator propeller domain-containing protein [Reichenbachiella ulvae]MCV9387423.1 response regulator [Reichenbachiella ulvae]
MRFLLLMIAMIQVVVPITARPIDAKKIKKIGMQEGLSLNSALCIIQDHQGIIWIGTSDGLNKFNGLDNEIFKYNFDDSLSISNNQINCLFEDSKKNIWIGTANGLNRLNKDESFTKYFADNSSLSIPNRYVKCIAETRDGRIWIGTPEGLSIYDPKNNQMERRRIKEIASNTNNIISLFNDLENRLWVCTKGGLFLVTPEDQFEKVTIDAKLENNKDEFELRNLTQQGNGNYWLASENHGLFNFEFDDEKTIQVRQFNIKNSNLVSDHIRKLKVIDDNQIWCATLDGLGYWNADQSSFHEVNWEGLSESSFHDILVDSNEGIWVTSYLDGAVYYHRQNNLFPHIKESKIDAHGLNDNSITGFLDDGPNGYWVSTGNGGLNYYDQSKGIFEHFTKNEISLTNNIKSLTYDNQKNIWLGTFNGLVYFDRGNYRFEYYQHDQNDQNSLNNNQIHAVHVDENDLLWLGTNGGGIQTFDRTKNTFDSVYTAYYNIRTIYEDSHNRIWVGSTGQLECIDRITKKLINIDAMLAPFKSKLTYVNCIMEDSHGRLLIGTQNNGLFVLDDQKISWFNINNGLISNTINSIEEGDSSRFWISSNNGLTRILLPKTLPDGLELTSINYGMSHGLQSLQFEPNSSMKTTDGRLFFGGINGYNAFYPQAIDKRHYFPPVVLSELNITNDQSLNQSFSYPIHQLEKDSIITLNYDQRNLLLRFAGVNYINPEKIHYRYSLNKSEDNWIDLQNQRTLNITYLPIGDHELKIKASTEPDQWGVEYTSIRFRVLPPFWKTWWAYTFYILLLSVLLYLFFNLSMKWAKMKSNLSMEQFQREKEHELNETKLRFFTDMSHELRTPLTLILAPVENLMEQSGISDRFKNQLAMIQRNGNRMTQLINQLLDFRKLETGNANLRVAKGNLIAFLKEICLAFDGIAENKNINFQFSANQDKLPIWFDRDKIEIVFFNLLSNAFKYTPEGGDIKLEISEVDSKDLPSGIKHGSKQKGVKISITDSGLGISQQDIENIFERYFSKKGNLENHQTGIGLELSKRMIQLHKGQILVQSQEETKEYNGFTTFIIYLLQGNKHFEKEDLITDFKNSEDVSQYTRDFIQREKEMDLQALSEEKVWNRQTNKKTILVIEDNYEVRKFITELLSKNFSIIESENGREGLEKALEHGPDMIISDVMMPEMNGIDLCKKVKQDTRISHTPVILLTARTAITFKYEGFETGADEYITKPFSANYLLLRVNNLLEQRERLQRHFQSMNLLQPAELSVTSVDEKLLKKAIDYISKNLSNTNITVNELSHELGLSRVHFYRKMKALTNMTAVEFIRSIRLKTACQLLEQGKFNIKEVKNLVGFEDADYFRKCFKEAYGMTPSEYSKTHA